MTWGATPLRVAVVGAGGVGSYLGSRLAAAGADVGYLARGSNLEALRERGLTIVKPDGSSSSTPVRATDDERAIGPVDLILFTVKSYDTDAAARRVAPMLTGDTAVLSLQNGIDNEAKIAAVVGDSRVLGGAAYILASIQAPGVIRSNDARIVVGELMPGPPSERVLRIVELARAGGVGADASDDVTRLKWEKYVLLVAFASVSAGTQLPLGDIRRSPAAVAMFRAIAHEALAVGQALGVALDDDLADRQVERVLGLADDEGTSLRHDLLRGRRMEIEALQGTLARLGRETGVPTPFTDAAYAVLQPWAIRNEGNFNEGNRNEGTPS
ncbi:MAG TPA: 2-dehydropantoate 2-reductase [Candidatus Limnocylindrales bacterium]|nr:2-dehydropantoate 2-reductase [Candidatus Limnocylindrales bacterium]